MMWFYDGLLNVMFCFISVVSSQALPPRCCTRLLWTRGNCDSASDIQVVIYLTTFSGDGPMTLVKRLAKKWWNTENNKTKYSLIIQFFILFTHKYSDKKSSRFTSKFGFVFSSRVHLCVIPNFNVLNGRDEVDLTRQHYLNKRFCF